MPEAGAVNGSLMACWCFQNKIIEIRFLYFNIKGFFDNASKGEEKKQ